MGRGRQTTITRMSPAISRALAVVGAALCGAAFLAAGVYLRPAEIVRSVDNGGAWYARTPGWFVARGVYPSEQAPDGGAFAWASGRVRLQIPRLDRDVEYRLRVRARSGRSPAEPQPTLRVIVDGLDSAQVPLTPEWQDVDVRLPPARRAGAVVLLETDQTFVPGPQDQRPLAFTIHRLTLSRAEGGPVMPDREALLQVAAFAAAVALVSAICALPAAMTFAAGVAAGAAVSLLLLFDSAFLSGYSATFVELALVILVLGGVVATLSRLAEPQARQAWCLAALLALVVTCLRLALFAHPDAPVGDSIFHVHRAQEVHAGQYLFTSITPKPFYEFPYPVGLYVVAQPFWERFGDRVFLLRAITLVADGLVALGLFAAVSARWGSRLAGVLATAIALAVPVVTQTISTANLTNAFAQSCFSLAIVWIAWYLPSPRWVLAGIGSMVLLTAAYLSHFSTAVIGMPVAVLAAVLVALTRDDREARAWRWVMGSVLLALVLSYVVYYSHFHEVYAKTLSRIGTEKAETSLVATLAEHSESKPATLLRFLLVNYGWGALLLAGAGVVAAVRRGWREGWTLVLAALALTVVIFFALGAFTPIEMRANLAAHPLVAALAALGAAWLWTTGRALPRALALLGLVWTAWIGIAAIRDVLG
jgi:hypothetical protein